jgi:DivIVA domain-containing protein
MTTSDGSRPGPTELDVGSIDARRKDFHATWFQGYRKSDVDTYLDEVTESMRARIQENEGLRAGLPVPGPVSGTERVTPFDVQAKEFMMARFGRGYRMRDVDEYMDEVTEMMSWLEAENAALKELSESS